MFYGTVGSVEVFRVSKSFTDVLLQQIISLMAIKALGGSTCENYFALYSSTLSSVIFFS